MLFTLAVPMSILSVLDFPKPSTRERAAHPEAPISTPILVITTTISHVILPSNGLSTTSTVVLSELARHDGLEVIDDNDLFVSDENTHRKQDTRIDFPPAQYVYTSMPTAFRI